MKYQLTIERPKEAERASDVLAFAFAALRRAAADQDLPVNPACTHKAMLDTWMAGGLLILIARDENDEMVGCVVHTIATTLLGVVVAMGGATFVLPSHRGNGLAKRMIEVATQSLAKMGVQYFVSTVMDGSPLQKYFESRGVKYKHRVGMLEL